MPFFHHTWAFHPGRYVQTDRCVQAVLPKVQALSVASAARDITTYWFEIPTMCPHCSLGVPLTVAMPTKFSKVT